MYKTYESIFSISEKVNSSSTSGVEVGSLIRFFRSLCLFHLFRLLRSRNPVSVCRGRRVGVGDGVSVCFGVGVFVGFGVSGTAVGSVVELVSLPPPWLRYLPHPEFLPLPR